MSKNLRPPREHVFRGSARARSATADPGTPRAQRHRQFLFFRVGRRAFRHRSGIDRKNPDPNVSSSLHTRVGHRSDAYGRGPDEIATESPFRADPHRGHCVRSVAIATRTDAVFASGTGTATEVALGAGPGASRHVTPTRAPACPPVRSGPARTAERRHVRSRPRRG